MIVGVLFGLTDYVYWLYGTDLGVYGAVDELIAHKNRGMIKQKFQKGDLYMRRYVMFA